MAERLMPSRYFISTLAAMSLFITPKVEMLVAGWAIINTNAVAGDMPAKINSAAIGVDVIAQIDLVIDIAIITHIAPRPLS